MTESTKDWLVLGMTSIPYWQKWKTILKSCSVLPTQVKDTIPSDPATRHMHILTKRHMQHS